MKKYYTSTSMFIGESMDGTPVFWDVHSAPFNNKPPVTVITGSPGTGKTYLGSIIVANSAIAGKKTAVLDPKGDFLPLVNLEEYIGEVNIIDLRESKAGSLDFFNLSIPPGEKLALATTVIDLFLGELEPEELTILQPLIKDVISGPNPSLYKVMTELKKTQGDSPESARARQMGSRLDAISVMPFARLCFSPGKSKEKLGLLSENLTIITILGLPMPKTESEMKEESGRLSSGILYLLTYFLGNMMLEPNPNKLPRTLFIDEAWRILGNPKGAALVESIANLGRSLNVGMVLATQSNSHLNSLDIENSVSTRFAFNTDSKDAKNIIKAMELSEDEGFEEAFTALGTGQCIMQDWEKRYAAIAVKMWHPEWQELVMTNPKDRMMAAAAKKKNQSS